MFRTQEVCHLYPRTNRPRCCFSKGGDMFHTGAF